nr:ABC transporter ATP-binding protein [Candidatus Gracilibacteria bacterium]
MKQTIKKLFVNFKKIIGAKMYYSIFAFGLFTSIVSLSEPFVFAKLLNYLEGVLKGNTFSFNELSVFIIFWILLIISTLVTSYIYRYYFVDLNILKFLSETQKKYSHILINMSYNEYLGKKQGEIYRKFDKGTSDQFSILFFVLQEIIKTLSGIFIIIILLFILNWKMAFATVSMLPIMFFMGFYFNKKTVLLQKENNDKGNELMGYLGDNLTNLALVKILSLENSVKKHFQKGYDKLMKDQYGISKRWSIADIYIGVLVMTARLITLLLGAYMVSKGTLSLGYLFLYFSFIGWVYFPLGGMFGRLRDIQKQIVSIQTFYDDFDNLELEKDEFGKEDLKKVAGDIEFKNVHFSYNKDREILKNINFTIKDGEKIAFVGDTGAGKSTMVNLLFRLWDIERGEILIDGKNIKNINKKSLRCHIGIVMQDNTLFNTSIKANLEIAREKAKNEDIIDALKKAKADFVFCLKDGIDTVIGERGLKLSGGEKQRLSIARLFLKDPEILILDEATSALDNKTEKEIQKSLDNLMKGRTTIIIAHRLTTIKKVDRIFVLENGKIIETGNYDELIKSKGKFFELANPDKIIM